MQLPRLDIHNSFAQIGINKSRATIKMKQPMAEVKMNQPQPEVEMNKTEGKLEIDQSEAFADANLKHPLRFMEETAQKAKQKVLQSLAKEAAEGKRLMKIEDSRKSVIPQIAKKNSETPPKQVNIGYMPSAFDKVKFHYQPSKIDVTVHKGNFHIEIKPNQPIIKFNPGDFQIYLKQKAAMSIKAIGTGFDQKI